jgi:Flp pilus assembly protein TadG
VQIEFILSFLVVMFLIFGMWEMIMVMHTMNVLSDAAKEGVRYAIVHGDRNNSGYQSSSADVTAIEQVVRDYAKLSLHDISAISVNVCYPPASGSGCDGSNAAPNRVRVDVAYAFVPYTALNIRPTLHAAAEGRIVY